MAIDFGGNSFGGEVLDFPRKFISNNLNLIIGIIAVLIVLVIIQYFHIFGVGTSKSNYTISPTGDSNYVYAGALAGGGPLPVSSIFGSSNQDLSGQYACGCSKVQGLTGNRGDPQLWEYSYDLQNAVASKVNESRNAGPAEVVSPSTPTTSQATIQKFALREGWANDGDRQAFGMREGGPTLITPDPLADIQFS